jgi:ribosomal protein L40E
VNDVKNCPDCLSEIPEAASFCRFCGERVEGKACPACGVRNAGQAVRCRWCGHTYEAPTPGVELEPFTVTAALLPTFLQRGRLLCQSISLNREKIVISTPGLLNLSRQEEEIPWRKVAGFDYHSGIFWDRVTIETRGQSSSTLTCLNKADGARIRQVLQELES